MARLHECWLTGGRNIDPVRWADHFSSVYCDSNGRVAVSAVNELMRTAKDIGADMRRKKERETAGFALVTDKLLGAGGYSISVGDTTITIKGGDDSGLLYGVFRFIILSSGGYSREEMTLSEQPAYPLRMINHWDNADGSIERGYAGSSIFFANGAVTRDRDRITDYARLMSSVGINAVCLNNVNVHKTETLFITDTFLDDIAFIADIFSDYGIKLFLSVNFAAPAEIGGCDTADPLDENVRSWWRDTAANIYRHIPDFGGFLVKADSENRPGPFTYGRDHADGANMLAEALKPFGGIVVWRCFVYNCHTDWRDRSTDRAKAAYDNFVPLDGKFADNVYLQVKNGPMDFQIREPVSPLFGALGRTNVLAEFQITQEYTGQQIDLCCLVPMWKECLDFDTFRGGAGDTVNKRILGAAGVSNIGDGDYLTGDPLAGANLYGYGRLIFDPSLSAEQIVSEWVRAALTHEPEAVKTIVSMLMQSRGIYESYTSPLGVGWMVVPHSHYGVDVDGYEYSQWGTYHYADRDGIGVDRTSATGTGYVAQYADANARLYEDINTCPDELLLFFHHVPYTHVLKSGKTVIQHIYDSHFDGAEKARELLDCWRGLKDAVLPEIHAEALKRFELQLKNAERWRDVVNTYFFRKSGIDDIHGRKIYN
ncbi:MAG: alpha-glucuronidase [Ruminiclostridium sp.]|nr:alpha-glucuronidase [Ruminiclostridium sp.]